MKFDSIKTLLAAACISVAAASCENDMTIAWDDPRDLSGIDRIGAFLTNAKSPRNMAVLDVRGDSGEGQLYIRLSAPSSGGADFRLSVAPDVLTDWNLRHGTDYEPFPAEAVEFEQDGAVTVAPGDRESAPVRLYVSRAELDEGKTYLLPVRAESLTDGIELSEPEYLFTVKQNLPGTLDADKGTGIVTIVYFEVGDHNILNAGEFFMKSSNKPFIDIVNIFAANINYDKQAHRAYVSCNSSVKHILEHRDEYIKPLQDKGIRVCMTILGNHDNAGVSGLTDEQAADFARELKTYVDAYGLDGVDFDDEYSVYGSPDFAPASGERAARLVYECRKLMPDKLITFYDYGLPPKGSVEGIPAGALIDYSYGAMYGQWHDPTITGLTVGQFGPYPLKITNGFSFKENYMRDLRKKGYGVCMFYNMNDYNYQRNFTQVAKILYDDEVVWTGRLYKKEDPVGYTK